MATTNIEVHGSNTTHSDPTITARVSTTFTGYSSTTPLYTVTITLNALTSPWYFGFDLWIYLNNQDKKIKPTSPPDESPYGRWGPNKYSVTFTNVPYNSQPIIYSTNCGCGRWNAKPNIVYDDPYTPPGKINDLKINNKSSVGLDHLSDALNLTWSIPTAGALSIEGYRIEYKINNGSYTLLTNTENNYYNTSLQPFEELINRGDTITFRVKAYDLIGSGEYSNTVTCLFNNITLELSVNPIGINMAKINWTCTENCSQIEYKLGTANYKVASTGLNTASGNFNIPNLTYKTNYTVQVAAVLKASGQRVYASINFTTLDIGRIQSVPTPWNIEEPITIKVKLPEASGVNYSFSVSYNNIDIISRPNISITNNEYTLNLTQEEKNFIYGITETDANPSVKFNLKTYVSQLVGTDSKTIPLTFNTKAWVKVSNSWKRAFVWLKVNGTWQISNPWVKVGNTWKKI